MYRVLIVDDDRATRYMLKRFKNWSSYGFTIENEACDGKEAVKKVSENIIDLVITDIKMPGMDGIEFLQEIKRLGYDTCVIFLSTHSDFEYAKQGIRLGVFDYMTKPVDENVLCEVLERTKKHLDEKNHQKIIAQEEKKIIEESLNIFYSKSREESLAHFLMSGSSDLLKEGEITFQDIYSTLGDVFKIQKLLETILVRLLDTVHTAYPWIAGIEKMNFDGIRNNNSFEDLKNSFLEYIKGMLDIVKKYELHQADSIVKKTCEYVLNHVEGEIKLENIALDVHVRSDYIGKLFKKKTGCNLNDYVTMVKMEHAKHLIKSGDLKNYEVSERLGYSSPDYFCRLFKNYTGLTPLEFRKS
ncbi:MAG TPA: response regulator [Clostridia bacterium]